MQKITYRHQQYGDQHGQGKGYYQVAAKENKQGNQGQHQQYHGEPEVEGLLLCHYKWLGVRRFTVNYLFRINSCARGNGFA